MYVGYRVDLPDAVTKSRELGLFVEPLPRRTESADSSSYQPPATSANVSVETIITSSSGFFSSGFLSASFFFCASWPDL